MLKLCPNMYDCYILLSVYLEIHVTLRPGSVGWWNIIPFRERVQPVRNASRERPVLGSLFWVRVLHWALTGQVASWVRKRPQVHLLPADTVTVTKVKVCVPMEYHVAEQRRLRWHLTLLMPCFWPTECIFVRLRLTWKGNLTIVVLTIFSKCLNLKRRLL